MARPIRIRADLSVDELERRYRRALDPVARNPWPIVWLLAQGHSSARVAEATGYSLTWLLPIARRYWAEGEAGIGDRRHGNRGGPRRLTAEQEGELERALEGAAPDGGVWTAAQVAAWIAERTGTAVSSTCGWGYLRRLDRRR